MKRNRGPVDGYSVGCGHGGMKRNRHDQKMSPNPLPNMSSAGPSRDILDVIGKPELRGTRNAQQDREMVAEATKPKAKRNKERVGRVLAKASSDMAAQTKADQERFSAEHDQAVAEGRAMRDSMQRSTPGKAQDIIKRRRV